MFTVQLGKYYPNCVDIYGPYSDYDSYVNRTYPTEVEACNAFNLYVDRFTKELGNPTNVEENSVRWDLDNATDSEEHCYIAINMYKDPQPDLDNVFKELIAYARQHKVVVDKYTLVLSDVGDAFFPDPREVEEAYGSLVEARERIHEVTTTHLKYTYTPLRLIYPDGTEEDVYPKND